MALLEIDQVTVRFGGLTALSDVSFDVADGEFVSVIGPNGAGKTTLFNAIAGAIKSTSGTIRFKGSEVQGSKPAHMSHVGVRRSFQVARPFSSMTVRENIQVASAKKAVLHSGRCLGPARRDRRTREHVEELLGLVDLSAWADRKASELNIGALRRLEIARALASEPSLLLLDEPAAGIGVDGLRPLAELIKGVHQRGLTVLLVEHNVGLALSLSDRVVVLDEGHLLALGTPEQVRNDERVISAYLGRQGARQAAAGVVKGLPMKAEAVMLEVDGLTAGYGRVPVLYGISLTVLEGQFVTIVGANGAGKTTLLQALMGLVPATGVAVFRGKPLLPQPAHRRVDLGIGYVPEGRHVFPALTVDENLQLTAARRHEKGGSGRAIDEVYEVFPRLGERRRQTSRSLSGGEQQMLAFGRALVLDADFLILDEISLGLAPVVVDRLYDVLLEIHGRGKTILLAEQNARVALEAADMVYVMEAGRIALQGPAAELRTDPRIVEAYLSSL